MSQVLSCIDLLRNIKKGSIKNHSIFRVNDWGVEVEYLNGDLVFGKDILTGKETPDYHKSLRDRLDMNTFLNLTFIYIGENPEVHKNRLEDIIEENHRLSEKVDDLITFIFNNYYQMTFVDERQFERKKREILEEICNKKEEEWG